VHVWSVAVCKSHTPILLLPLHALAESKRLAGEFKNVGMMREAIDQRIVFVDPKGIRNLEGLNDPKIKFHQKIKELEVQLNDPKVKLDSFIISNTPYRAVNWWENGISMDEFEKHHVLFQVEDQAVYIHKILNQV